MTFLHRSVWADSNTVIYIILNTKSTKFKQWIKDILIGYSIIDQYKNASIFIVSNRFYKEPDKLHEYLNATIPDGGSKSDLISFKDESLVNNDYMKNFQTTLENDRISKRISKV